MGLKAKSGKLEPDEAAKWRKLMARAQAGNQGAYEQLLSEIYPAIRNYLMKKLGPYAFEEDIVQDCLVAIHKAKRTYDPDREFKPWMYAVIRNKLIDSLRKRQRRALKEVADTEIVETKSVDPTYIEDEGVKNSVQEALAGLPDEMRRAVELTKIEGLSTKEAAEKESTTEAAIRTRISRAYKLMRRSLEKENGW